MSEKILVILGSSREHGNTETLADAFIAGAEESGNSVLKYSLRGKDIQPCLACDFCYKNDTCIRRDDMDEVYTLLSWADVLVFAAPVYFFGLPAQFKALIDRLHNPVRSSFPIRALALLTVGADEADAGFEPIRSTCRAIADYLGWEDLGSVAVGGVDKRGAIAGNPALQQARELGRGINKTRPGGIARA